MKIIIGVLSLLAISSAYALDMKVNKARMYLKYDTTLQIDAVIDESCKDGGVHITLSDKNYSGDDYELEIVRASCLSVATVDDIIQALTEAKKTANKLRSHKAVLENDLQ
jgi:uncharacterized membrane-anchored protein